MTQNFTVANHTFDLHLSMKVFTYTFAEDENMLKTTDTSVTTQTSSRFAAQEPCIKAKVGTLLTS